MIICRYCTVYRTDGQTDGKVKVEAIEALHQHFKMQHRQRGKEVQINKHIVHDDICVHDLGQGHMCLHDINSNACIK